MIAAFLAPPLLNVSEITPEKFLIPTVQLLTSTRCTDMIDNYSAEIKIVIFQSVLECTVTNEDRRQIAGESRQNGAL